ncbi:NAD-dependent epimerase/dehydratase family protein [Psychroserpens sp.]
MKKVGIIGGSGFIGSHTTKRFLNEGYKVKVSATDITKEEKYQHLMQLQHAENLHVSELNIEDKAALQDFVKDCDIVIHGGTPFKLDVENPQAELFDPTIKGTENFLEVINKTPSIEKVVFIASVAAYNTNFPMPADGKSTDDTFSENDLPFISKNSHPYGQAKFIANQTVEKFIKEHPQSSFEISSVSPVFVTGKSLSNREDSTSTRMQFLFKNNIAPNPFVQMLYDLDVEFAMVDVKDVANSIYKSATTKGLHGKNYLLSSETYHVSDISRMLNRQVPVNKPKTVYSNNLATQELGINFLSAETSLHGY